MVEKIKEKREAIEKIVERIKDKEVKQIFSKTNVCTFPSATSAILQMNGITIFLSERRKMKQITAAGLTTTQRSKILTLKPPNF